MNGYITQQQLIKAQLKAGQTLNKTAYLWDLVQSHVTSPTRKRMLEGVEYYEAQHKIRFKTRTYFVEGREELAKGSANTKLAHPFHRILVNQKAAYIAGNPVVISIAVPSEADDNTYKNARDFQKSLIELLGNSFDDCIADWIKGASNQGQYWLHPYINEFGLLKYTLVPSSEILSVYDTTNQDTLLSVYRYYTVDYQDYGSTEVRQLYKLEVWTANDVTYYTQDVSGKAVFVLDSDYPINPMGHFTREFTGGAVEQVSWGTVPFICLQNNTELTTDLEPIKTLIDAYDRVKSGWADDLEDFQEAIYVVKDYQGISSEAQKGLSELAIFLQNLKVHKVVAVDGTGGVDTISAKIPVEAKQKFLDITLKEIFFFGEGVNTNDDKFGNSPSGVALRFHYSLLDLKANRTIRKLKVALSILMNFVFQYMSFKNIAISYKPSDVLFTINKTIIFNEKEKIDGVMASEGLLSKQTLLENHPYVNDVDEEQNRLKRDEAESIASGLIDLDTASSTVDGNNKPTV